MRGYLLVYLVDMLRFVLLAIIRHVCILQARNKDHKDDEAEVIINARSRQGFDRASVHRVYKFFGQSNFTYSSLDIIGCVFVHRRFRFLNRIVKHT